MNFKELKKPKSLTHKIILSMILGLIFGVLLNTFFNFPWISNYIVGGILTLGGRIFISTLNLMVVPLVFVSLVCGTAAIDDVKKLGRIGGKTFILYILTTALAVVIALFFAELFKPGLGFNLTTDVSFKPNEAPKLIDTLANIFPSNPFQAFSEGNMLQIIVFAGIFGFALASSGASGSRILNFFNDMNEVVMRVVTMVMYIAPYGVFCLISKVFAEQGLAAILPMAKYFVLVIFVLAVHFGLVYSALLKFLANLNPLIFYKKFKDVCVFAFSTSSSNATIPITLDTVEHKLGVDNSIASFSIPLGATVNMDGTAIMQGVATVFIAQAYGITLSIQDLAMVVLSATLASVGTAGVPGVGLITLAMVLNQVQLPVEGIGLIIGVDRLLDMSRTVVNVTGDAVVSIIVAKSEKKLDIQLYNKPNNT